ncbi:hypothetical protein CPB84DRAFT_1781251 [Gymnopilus junonius]|uniref:NAD-dependent epimerase/dehydratase domain-containing protein n=1 Tax=Gymnopilus junonius TaxID=109634 RepID=A0A9P5TLC5_GYMJU|nr:hypothetical protein CPB84DRAFT_1781251 [Gymnopilus junonius]
MPAFHGLTFNETMWAELNEEEFLKNQEDKYYIYFTAKIKAEKALWEFAAEHPEISVATILPGYVIGPYPKTFPRPTSIGNTGTNDFVHGMISKGEVPFAPNWIVDVRDVAKGHVRALEKLPLPSGDIGRFIVNGATLPWKKAAEHLKKARPEVADRIVDLETVNPLPGVLSTLDTTRAKEILGIEFIPTEKTFEDAVDDLLALEKEWKN